MEVTIIEKLKQLPPQYHEEVINFIDSLLNQEISNKKKIPKLEWIGGLKEYRKQYTSLELQRKALDWRD